VHCVLYAGGCGAGAWHPKPTHSEPSHKADEVVMSPAGHDGGA
jgi:hypothetical protein